MATYLSQKLNQFASLWPIPIVSHALSHVVMKSIDDIRRENMALLVHEHGSVTGLATTLQRSDSQVSQWLHGSLNSGTGKPRGMRSTTARFIEEAVGRPSGWMDRDHSHPQPAGGGESRQAQSVSDPPLDVPLLTRAIEAVQQEFAAAGKAPSYRQLAAGIAVFYNSAQRNQRKRQAAKEVRGALGKISNPRPSKEGRHA